MNRDMSIAHAVNGVGYSEGLDSRLRKIAAELIDDREPRVVQDQRSTHDQLVDLVDIANKNGKYDAADWLKRELGLDELANKAGHTCTFPCEVCASTDRNYDMKLHETRPGEDWRDVRAARDFQRD
jgi:hypothetical protein